MLGGNRVEASSAEIEAHGQNLRAIVVMREAGAVISTQVSVYVLVAIVKKELQLDVSSITLLQILSVTVFEKMLLQQALTENARVSSNPVNPKQLNLFGV